MRDSIFFSYCREDFRWLNELKASLAASGNEVRLNVWDDSRISPAAEWRREIDEALATAAAAVLLLSPDFFASEFIGKYELPSLIEAARRSENVICFLEGQLCQLRATALMENAAARVGAVPEHSNCSDSGVGAED